MTKSKALKLFFGLVIIYTLLPNISLAVCCPVSGTCSGLGLPDCSPVRPGYCENNLQLCYPSFGSINLALNTPLNSLIAWLYYGIVGLAGLAAFFRIVQSGIQYLTSAGNPGAMSDARDRMWYAVLGLFLVFTSYIILQVINPELIILRPPAIP